MGLFGAWAAARGLEDLVFGITAGDPATFAAVSAMLLATALAASYIPARRAARVDPMVKMRVE